MGDRQKRTPAMKPSCWHNRRSDRHPDPCAASHQQSEDLAARPAPELGRRADLHQRPGGGVEEFQAPSLHPAARVARRIDEYIENWRCLFLPESNPYLFPGRNSRPKDESSLRRQIVRHLFNQTGVRLTPTSSSFRQQIDPGLASGILRTGPKVTRPQVSQCRLRELLRHRTKVGVRIL